MSENRRWSTDQELLAIRLCREGATLAAIAAALGRTFHSVRGRLRRMGYGQNPTTAAINREAYKHTVWTRPEKRNAKSLLESGMSIAEAARELGRSEVSLRKFIWRTNNPLYRDPSGVIATRTKPDPNSIEERDRRYNEPRTLTMELLGDPEPSRSALGKLRDRQSRGKTSGLSVNALPGGLT